VSKDTLRGLRVHIRHLRRKKVEMCKLLESVPQVVSEDKETGKLNEDVESKTEKFDEGKRGGAEPEITEANAKRAFLRTLQYRADDDVPREDILEKMGTTKEEWIKTNRILRDDKPHDDDLKWLGTSKEGLFEAKRRIAWMDAFGCNSENKMRKY